MRADGKIRRLWQVHAQEKSRMYETVESWDGTNSQVDLENPIKRCRSKGRRSLEPVECCSNYSRRIQHDTRQHAELGQAHCARLKYQSVQQVTAGKQDVLVPQRKHSEHGRFFYFTERDQDSCDLRGVYHLTDNYYIFDVVHFFELMKTVTTVRFCVPNVH